MNKPASEAASTRPASPGSTNGDATTETQRVQTSDALHYWERRRLVYNAVLAVVVATVFGAHADRFLRNASPDLFLGLFLLAVLANVMYCAAYPADLFVQRSGSQRALQWVRLSLFAIGTTFAAVLAQFIARGIVGSH
ncbi:hypothetical protein ACFFGH_16210 [Lysobacter korlensis]|uniref:Uncharacterized protein n=1 Tax=Lysobacter korlensis TaxID=553636 RepID=A0ABV6RQX9_9GAMM